MFHCYIIYSSSIDRYYIGSCEDLVNRLFKHNCGHAEFTSRGIPWELHWSQSFESKTSALKCEKALKRMKSRKFLLSVINGQKEVWLAKF